MLAPARQGQQQDGFREPLKDVTADGGTWGLIRLRQRRPAGPPTSDPLPGPGHKAQSPVKVTVSLTGPCGSERIRAGGVVGGETSIRGDWTGAVWAAGMPVQRDRSGARWQRGHGSEGIRAGRLGSRDGGLRGLEPGRAGTGSRTPVAERASALGDPPPRAQAVQSGALTLLQGKPSSSHKDWGTLESKDGAPFSSRVLTELGPALVLHDS